MCQNTSPEQCKPATPLKDGTHTNSDAVAIKAWQAARPWIVFAYLVVRYITKKFSPLRHYCCNTRLQQRSVTSETLPRPDGSAACGCNVLRIYFGERL